MQNFAVIVGLLVASFIGLSAAESCIQCSSANDRACVEQPHQIEATECTNNSTIGCFSRIVDGHTVRGCLADVGAQVCSTTPLCGSCININNGFGCNNQQFPEVRLFCHQCQAELNSTCAADILTGSTICRMYSENDQCFIRRTLTDMARGCNSDSTAWCGNREHCFFCDGHGCNSFNITDERIPLAPNSAVLTCSSIAMLLFMLVTAKLFQ